MEIFTTFLKLGLTSFGGPIAHLSYFHRELIERRRWLDESHYAQLVALCQFLPGPASSQLGFAIGLIRGGWRGALAAFVGFTLPSVMLLFAFAYLLPRLHQPLSHGAVHGLKLVAVAVVAQGVLAMARRLTPDIPRAAIAIVAGSVVAMTSSTGVQLMVIAMGAAAGAVVCRTPSNVPAAAFDIKYGSRTGLLLLGLFVVFLGAAIAIEHLRTPLIAAAGAFYRAGALVFGGGHVVLPLLQEALVTPGLVSKDDFLAGYGAAQAVPGPLFSVAAFLGARIDGVAGAITASIAIFLPGFLLVAGTLPLWRRIANSTASLSAVAGVNAAVVGVLAAALYDPVWLSAIEDAIDFAIALIAFMLLMIPRVSVLIAVTWCVAASLARFA